MTIYDETGLGVSVTVTARTTVKNPLTVARQALWTKLVADGTFTGFFAGGKLFKGDDGTYLPTRITQHDCPCLGITAAQAPSEWDTETKKELRYTFDCIGYTTGISRENAEQLYWTVQRAVYANWPALGQLNISAIEVGSPTIQPYQQEVRIEFWQTRFRIVLTLRETLLT